MGMILGGVGTGSTWLIIAVLVLFMFGSVFGGSELNGPEPP